MTPNPRTALLALLLPGVSALNFGARHEEPAMRTDATVLLSTEGRGEAELDIEVPKNYGKFMEGLMWREHMKENEGMVFPWNRNSMARSFWMKDTPLPLDMV